MVIQTFKNMKGLIHGGDPKRIGCDKAGILEIGKVKIDIVPESNSIMPLLFNGCTGRYNATFTDSEGNIYDLGTVEIQGGRIVPPPPTTVEFMELRCNYENLKEICDSLQRQIEILSHIFDTNSLNFLINKGDN
jgi:hypothetical protein